MGFGKIRAWEFFFLHVSLGLGFTVALLIHQIIPIVSVKYKNFGFWMKVKSKSIIRALRYDQPGLRLANVSTDPISQSSVPLNKEHA